MAGATTALAINSSTYTLASTALTQVLIQSPSRQNFEVYVGASAPAPNSPATPGIIIGELQGWTWQSPTLPATTNTYVRSCNPAGGVVEVIG